MERSQAITGMKEDKSPGLPGITNERKFHRGDAPLWFFLVLKLMEDSTINILRWEHSGKSPFPSRYWLGWAELKAQVCWVIRASTRMKRWRRGPAAWVGSGGCRSR